MTPRQLLADLGLDEHADAFEAVGIDAGLLPFVTERDLRSLGVPEVHHPAILGAVAALDRDRPSTPLAPHPLPSNPFQAPVERPLPRTGIYADAEPARRATRLAAKMLDWLVHGLACAPGLILVTLSDPSADHLLASVVVLLGFLLAVAGGLGVPALNWVLTATEGKTIGKKALGIRVVLLDGSPVNFMSGVFMRVWVLGFIKIGAAAVSLNTLISLADSLFILGNGRRCIHDHIAGTRVIES